MSQPSPSLQSPTHQPLLKETLGTPDTPATGVTELQTPSTTSKDPATPPSLGGALPDLLLGAFLPCVPVAVVSALLLTLIFYNEVKLDPGYELLRAPTTQSIDNPSLLHQAAELKSTGGTAAYYCTVNPAVLATIAAWTSKVIPFITSSSMAVVAFFVGRRILNATRDNKTGQLPTPHQISILINLISGGGVRPLYDTVMYRLQNHERLVNPIPLAFGSLSFIVIITLLIGAADTWFAASTKPENKIALTPLSPAQEMYGRAFDPSICNATDIWQARQCPSNTTQALCNYPCSITAWNSASGEREGVQHAQPAARAFFENSPVNRILNISSHAGSSDNADRRFFFLGDVKPGQNIDFLATTTAMTTQCQVITQDCNIPATKDGFSCPGGYSIPSFGFAGGVGVEPNDNMGEDNMAAVGIQFFKDAGLQNPVGFTSNATELFSAQNPIHFMSWSRGFPPIDLSSNTYYNMTKNGYLQTDFSGDNVFILNCTSTIYKTAYAWVNGTVLQSANADGFYPILAPDYYGAILSAPFAINSALGHVSLQSAAALSAYSTTPELLATEFGDEFSRSAIALTAGIMVSETNIIEQLRNNSKLLTRVPKVPLYFLVGLKALYALASLTMAALAVTFTGPSEAQEVKARLTIEGLSAGFFEPAATQGRAVKKVEELFDEHNLQTEVEAPKKVGVKQTEAGGWVFVTSQVAQKAWTGLGLGAVVETLVDNAVNAGELGEAGRDYADLKKII